MFNWIKMGGLFLALVFGLFTDSRILAAQLTGNHLHCPIPLDVPLNAPLNAGAAPWSRPSSQDPAVSSGTIPSGAGPISQDPPLWSGAGRLFGQASRFGDASTGVAVVTSTGRLNMIEPQGLQTHLQLVAAPSQDGALSQMADQAEASSMMATPMDFTIDHADWPRVAVWSERAGGSTPATHFQKIAAIDRALDRTVTIGYLPTDPPTVVFLTTPHA